MKMENILILSTTTAAATAAAAAIAARTTFRNDLALTARWFPLVSLTLFKCEALSCSGHHGFSSRPVFSAAEVSLPPTRRGEGSLEGAFVFL